MAAVKDYGLSNVIEVEINEFSPPGDESLAYMLKRAGGVVVVRQGDIHALRGRKIKISVPADADLESDVTEITFELV